MSGTHRPASPVGSTTAGARRRKRRGRRRGNCHPGVVAVVVGAKAGGAVRAAGAKRHARGVGEVRVEVPR